MGVAMLYRIARFFGVVILVCCISKSVMAQIIHWELIGPSLSADSGSIRGGFDLNVASNSIFNITVQTGDSSAGYCFPCNNFAGSAGKHYFQPNPDGSDGYFSVNFIETFQTGDLIDRQYSLTLAGNVYFGSSSRHSFRTPGILSGLDLYETGFLRFDDPYGPNDIYDADGCQSCVTAIGTLLPVPEPEIYLMLLAGLAILLWRANCNINAKSICNPVIG